MTAGSQGTVSTTETQSLAQGVRGRRLRRAMVAGLLVFMAAALLGWLGPTQRSVTITGPDAGPGYEVTLSHPDRSRGGLAASWAVEISSLGGEPLPPVEIRTTASYFDLFDENSLDPDPERAWQDSDDLVWSFEPEDESELTVSLDVRIQPNARWRHPAVTTVSVAGETVARFDYRTLAVP